MNTYCIETELNLLQLAREHGDRLVQTLPGRIGRGMAPAKPGLQQWDNPENIESGVSGGILFLLELYRQTREEKYLQAINNVVHEVLAYCESHPTYNYSLYTGRSGVVYVLMQLHALTGESRLLSECLRLVKPAVQEYLHSKYTSDYLYDGRAGTLLLLVHLYLRTREEFLVSYIDQFVHKILSDASYHTRGIYWRNGEEMDLRPSCGFARGTAGIRYVVHQLSLYCADPALAFMLRGIDLFTDSCWADEIQNWGNASRDITSREILETYRKEFAAGNPALLTPGDDLYWANGAAGILFTSPEQPVQLTDRLASAVDNASSSSLFDGLAGLGLYYLQTASSEPLNRIAAAVASTLPDVGGEETDSGLLHSVTGQAYFLLKANNPEGEENILFPFKKQQQEEMIIDSPVGFPWLRKQVLMKCYPRTVYVLEEAAPGSFTAYLEQPATEDPAGEKKKFAGYVTSAAETGLDVSLHERVLDVFMLEKSKDEYFEAQTTKPRLQAYLEELDFYDSLVPVLNKPDEWLLQQTLSISTRMMMVHTQWDWGFSDHFEPMREADTLEKFKNNLVAAPREYEYILQISGRQEILEIPCGMSFQLVLHRFMEPKVLAQAITEVKKYVHSLPAKELIALVNTVSVGNGSSPAGFLRELNKMILNNIRPLVHRNILVLD